MTIKTIILVLFLSVIIVAQSNKTGGSVIWKINAVSDIGQNTTGKIGNPETIIAGKDSAVRFNGINDGLMVQSNPLSGAKEFTVEVIFKPAKASFDKNHEQRFVHIQESPSKRILIELRITREGKWFLDTFLKSDTSSKTLYSEDITHATGKWYCAALVYKNGIMRDYVNGKEEHWGNVNFIPMKDGKVSIGVRQDLRSWFKGEIKEIRFTKEALSPSEFLSVKN